MPDTAQQRLAKDLASISTTRSKVPYLHSKLTPIQVLTIRSRYGRGLGNISSLAIEYGVARFTIQSIVQRRTWRWLRNCTSVPPRRSSTRHRGRPAAASTGKAIGIRQGSSRLTAEDVRIIRQRYLRGDDTNAIAAEYGISRTYVYQIGKRKKWAWLADE